MIFQLSRFILLVILVLVTSPFLQPSFAADSAVVLMYHRFGDSRFPSTNTRIEQLDAQLRYLRDNNYKVVPLAAVIKALTEGRSLPQRAVAITVDDAYKSVYDSGFPRFQEYGYPITVFVATDPVDQGYRDYMSWDQMREMESAGATFANHSASHGYLINRGKKETKSAWLARIRTDIDKGWRRLAAELNPLPGVFAHPFGEYNTEITGILQDAGYIAFGQQSGPIGLYSDRRALPRFPMGEAYAGIDEFRIKVSSLPLPVLKIHPWDPVTTNNKPPIEVTLGDSDARLDKIACYVGGQGRSEVHWLKNRQAFIVRPQRTLNPGRQRVNCTAPRADGRYYWFSHLWIVRAADH